MRRVEKLVFQLVEELLFDELGVSLSAILAELEFFLA